MRRALRFGALVGALLCVRPAGAQSASPLTAADVEERLGRRLPRELAFMRADGGGVRLGSAFASERPVLLVLAYTRCRTLCPLVLHGLAAGIRGMRTPPGAAYQVLTISLDPRETPADARSARAMLLSESGLPPDSEAWQVWTGEEASLRTLAAALGFRYRYDPVSDQYAHPAVVFVLTPAGAISRYLYGIEFDAADLNRALGEARAGRSGSSLERVLLRCFHYVPALRRYGGWITAFVRSGASLVLLACGGLFLWLWRREPGRGGAA